MLTGVRDGGSCEPRERLDDSSGPSVTVCGSSSVYTQRASDAYKSVLSGVPQDRLGPVEGNKPDCLHKFPGRYMLLYHITTDSLNNLFTIQLSQQLIHTANV